MIKAFVFLSVLTMMVACAGNNNEKTSGADTTLASMPVQADTAAATPQIQNGCYRYNVQRDTVRMRLVINGNKVSGTLDYDMYEKDDRHGNIKGIRNGDIIKAEYTYAAEGTSSVQEVLFKIQADSLLEGTGEIMQQDNKFIFKDSAAVTYKQAFIKVECP